MVRHHPVLHGHPDDPEGEHLTRQPGSARRNRASGTRVAPGQVRGGSAPLDDDTVNINVTGINLKHERASPAVNPWLDDRPSAESCTLPSTKPRFAQERQTGPGTLKRERRQARPHGPKGRGNEVSGADERDDSSTGRSLGQRRMRPHATAGAAGLRHRRRRERSGLQGRERNGRRWRRSLLRRTSKTVFH